MSNDPDALIKDMPPVVTDVCEIYAKPVPNRVAYIQNTGDTEHMDVHWARFKRLARPQAIAGTCLVYAAEGHVAPRPEFLAEVLRTVIDASSWGRLNFRNIKVSPVRNP